MLCVPCVGCDVVVLAPNMILCGMFGAELEVADGAGFQFLAGGLVGVGLLLLFFLGSRCKLKQDAARQIVHTGLWIESR